MASREIIISDLSKEEVPPNKLAEITVRVKSRPGFVFLLDAHEKEVRDFLKLAHKKRLPGRPRGSKNGEKKESGEA